MIVLLGVPALPTPSGGATALYEMANALARRGHVVHVGHFPVRGGAIGTSDLSWFRFDDRVVHHYGDATRPAPDPSALPSGDVCFVPGFPAHCGLSAVYAQGVSGWREDHMVRTFTGPYPKVCTSRWLVDELGRRGIPHRQLVHVTNGLDHRTYRIVRPIEDRPPRIALLYNPHPVKRMGDALAVLEAVRAARPEVSAVLFGTSEPRETLPEWVDYVRDPPRRVLVEEIYNGSRFFLCTSGSEGFGFPGLEAMACGTTLVTTDTGGCRDYADHGTTAVVQPVGDVAGLTDALLELLADEDRRRALARAGVEAAAAFDWDRSAETMERFLEDYVADPDRFR